MTADDWNRDNVTGRAVWVLTDAGMVKTVTRTGANDLHGKPTIYVEAVRGPVDLGLVIPWDGVGVGDVDADRAGGGAICHVCGRELYRHPPDLDHLGVGSVLFLTLLCDGRSVKL